jgi:hypothetical protein
LFAWGFRPWLFRLDDIVANTLGLCWLLRKRRLEQQDGKSSGRPCPHT